MPRSSSTASPSTAAITDHAPIDASAVIIEAIDGPGKGPTARLSRGTLTIGNQDGCDLVIDDKTVSRQHAEVTLAAGGVRVKDLGSRNGTRYLNARIEEAQVPFGGIVHVGKTALRFRPEHVAVIEEADPLGGLIGRSSIARQLFAQLRRLARSDVAVLFIGETGTGKEAAARAVHEASARATAPFVIFDCHAVSANLIESELFGHVKGAFTGASSARRGSFAAAGEGTLLLDGLDELPLDLQPRLLRAIDAHCFTPVGGSGTQAVRCRIFASSRVDLHALATRGHFREDLYHRLAAATVCVPPLRDRPDDIPLLIKHFAKEASGVDVTLAGMTLAGFVCDRWPGNVRELRNTVLRVLTLGDASDLADSGETSKPPKAGSYIEARAKILERFERDFLTALMAHAGNDVDRAAKEAKMSPRQFYRLLARHRLTPRKQGG